MQQPNTKNMEALKRLVRFLKGSPRCLIVYGRQAEQQVVDKRRQEKRRSQTRFSAPNQCKTSETQFTTTAKCGRFSITVAFFYCGRHGVRVFLWLCLLRRSRLVPDGRTEQLNMKTQPSILMIRINVGSSWWKDAKVSRWLGGMVRSSVDTRFLTDRVDGVVCVSEPPTASNMCATLAVVTIRVVSILLLKSTTGLQSSS